MLAPELIRGRISPLLEAEPQPPFANKGPKPAEVLLAPARLWLVRLPALSQPKFELAGAAMRTSVSSVTMRTKPLPRRRA